MIHNTDDIAAFIVELTERTPAKDRTTGYLESAIERKFPGVDTEQLYATHDIAAETLKATGQRRRRRGSM